jgi:hypothetical protein
MNKLQKSVAKLFGIKTSSPKDEDIDVKQSSNTYTPTNFNTNELDEVYLYDFRAGWRNSGSFISIPVTDNDTQVPQVEKVIKVKIKPIDVLHELEIIPNPFSLELLDEKIVMLKEKEKLIKQHYTKREVTALIERLENRKKYQEYSQFFNLFQNTTQEKIDVLLQKYDLVMESSDLFIPEFPGDAIKVMKDYIENVKSVSNKEPVFYVIAEKEDFKKKDIARDPILLVQSPFGFYYQILGAWDKELILLSEL